MDDINVFWTVIVPFSALLAALFAGFATGLYASYCAKRDDVAAHYRRLKSAERYVTRIRCISCGAAGSYKIVGSGESSCEDEGEFRETDGAE